MKTGFRHRRLSFALGVVLFWVGAAGVVCARTEEFVMQTFDDGICAWNSFPPVSLAFDPTQDDTGDGGGSCHVSFNLSPNTLFNITADFDSCCICATELSMPLAEFASLDFDVKWDNSSTITPAQFNSNSGSGYPGIAIGILGATNLVFDVFPTVCYSNIFIPPAATGGWVHVSAPINPGSPYATNLPFGIYMADFFAAPGTGTAAFWVDNVKLIRLPGPQVVPAMAKRKGDNFTFYWAGNWGSTCTVLKSTNLVGWTTLVTDYPPGGMTPALSSYTDTAATNRQSYYLIKSP